MSDAYEVSPRDLGAGDMRRMLLGSMGELMARPDVMLNRFAMEDINEGWDM